MDKLKIIGNGPLEGSIAISGAKNAALPLMCASLLTAETLELSNLPQLADVNTMRKLLSVMGVQITSPEPGKLRLTATHLNNCFAPYDLVKTMRASILALGPLLTRFGEAKVSLPGGCAIGQRPVDQHILGLKALGAEVWIKHGYIYAQAKRLKGARLNLGMVSVTGTENLLMAATLAQGTTVISPAAQEPEVVDLIHCLNKMGARIEGAGTDTLTINGVKQLRGHTHAVVADRIEAGTFLVAAAATRGTLTLTDISPELLTAVVDKLQEMGAEITTGERWIRLRMTNRPQAAHIRTAPYPSFPTDMQAQFVALNCIANGESHVTETIFDNRFMHVQELSRMGANVEVVSDIATIKGVAQLSGAAVMATDLRASASLIIAGLVARGETVIDRIYHLDRGYEEIEKKLSSVGACIERISPQPLTNAV